MQLNTGGLRNRVRSSSDYSQSRVAPYWPFFLPRQRSFRRFGGGGLLTLSQDVAANGGRVVLNLNYTSAAMQKTQPVCLQWALAFNAQSVAKISIGPGAGAIAAGKSISCYQATGTYLCLALGLNSNSLQSGPVARMTVTFAPGYQGLVSFGVTNTLGVTAAGSAVPISAKGTAVVVSGVTSLACSPTALLSA